MADVRILVVDNYDSFVFNLVQYLAQLGADVVVRRNDEVSVAQSRALGVDGILLSPGPGRPEDAGVCVELVQSFAGHTPVLGVCLGHQAIAVAYGGKVLRAPELLHGKTSLVHHNGAGVLRGLPDPFTATRYHSLAARRQPAAPDTLANNDLVASIGRFIPHPRCAPGHGGRSNVVAGFKSSQRLIGVGRGRQDISG